MEINTDIYEVLEDFKIKREDGICYLLSLYFGFSPTYIPEDVKLKINLSKIIEIEIIKDKKDRIKWNIPLFEGQEVAFEWVKTEYVELFRPYGKASNVKDATDRMKKLFAKNPDIRKEEVLGATEMYLYSEAHRPMFIRMPHYFIEKGRGGERTQDILDWIDKYRNNVSETKQTYQGENLSKYNTSDLE